MTPDGLSKLEKLAAAKPSAAERLGNLAYSAQGRVQPLADRLHAPFVGLASMPFKAVGGLVSSALFGGKALAGPMKGRRLEPVPGGPGVGMSQIDRAEFEAIKAGKIKGRAFAGALEGNPIYYKRNYRPGGLVGLVQKHPGKAAIAAGGLYYLLNHREKAAPAYQLARGFLPVGEAPTSTISQQTVDSFSQQSSANNPLMSTSWGQR